MLQHTTAHRRSWIFDRLLSNHILSCCLWAFRKMKSWVPNFRIRCSVSEWKTICVSSDLNTTASQLNRSPKIASLSMKRHRHSEVSFGQ
jgi:hypothetical protein